MKFVLFWIFLLVCLFHFCPAQAADWSLKFGPGIENDATTGNTKMFGLRREESVFRGIYDAVELGGFVDHGESRNSSGYGKLQLGVKPGPMTGLYGYGFFGPCGITTTDSQLSTNLEFATDIGVGIRDRDTAMSMGYGHISNAGIRLPNHGRDYLLFSVGVNL